MTLWDSSTVQIRKRSEEDAGSLGTGVTVLNCLSWLLGIELGSSEREV